MESKMETTSIAVASSQSDNSTVPPPLFDQTNVRKPEYWQFAKLIAPSATLPPTKKHWTADDAVGIWCLKCSKALVFQKGSSQSIRYHMETKHRIELEAYRDHGKEEISSSTPSVRPLHLAKKRKVNGDDAVDETMGTPPTLSVDDVTTDPETNAMATDWTWARNLERRGGFWRNASWYDVHLERRLPLVKPMVDELVAALPPCDGKHVLDLLAGSGRATAALVAAYPTAFVTLVDASTERLGIAKQRLRTLGVHLADEQFIPVTLSPTTLATASPLPVDVVMASLALHVLVENDQSPLEKEVLYEQLFRGIWALLKPGGHFVFGDHVGQLPLFKQLQVLDRVGFVDVDCAWRQADFFVAGARKPLA